MHRLAPSETDQALILGLSGEIIMDVVPDLKAAIEELATRTAKTELVADLAAVTFMDSSGVGLLLHLLPPLCQDQGKAFHLANPSPPIKKLLDMLRLTEYFADGQPNPATDRRSA